MIFVLNSETMILIKIFNPTTESAFSLSTSCKLKKNMKKRRLNKKDCDKDIIVLTLEIF
jgi:hypothetical protein